MAPADTHVVEPGAAASAAAQAKLEDSISASYAVTSYQAPAYVLQYGSLNLANHVWLNPGIELGVGGRFGFGDHLVDGHCFEGFGSIGIAPHFITLTDAEGRTGSWQPLLGLEFGYTSADFKSVRVPQNSPMLDGPGPGGVYGAFETRPLRFRFSRFTVHALGLTFGTMLGHVGRQLRVQIEVIQVGFVL